MTQNTTDNLTDLIVEGIRRRKGRQITIVDLSHIESSAASRFIICEGTSTMHVASVADSIREYLLDEARIKPYNYDGYGASTWIVIDYGDTLVHVFQPETRRRYDLEDLWSDAVITNLPDED